jgi:hypothetical protein
MAIYLSDISEAGRNIAEHSERPEAASTAESTASLLGLVKFGGPCRSMPSGRYRRGTFEHFTGL